MDKASTLMQSLPPDRAARDMNGAIDYLSTHPSVAGRLAQNTLALSGWVYDIGHGSMRIYSEEHRKFVPVMDDEQAIAGATAK